MSDAKELRAQSNEELFNLESDKRKELFQLKSRQSKNDKDVKPSVVKGIKQDIARICTILHERKLDSKSK